MADDILLYEVIADKYVGKHGTYKKGKVITESEIFGDKEIALKGQKDATRKYNNDAKDAKPRKLKDVKPSLKAISKAEAKKKVNKK